MALIGRWLGDQKRAHPANEQVLGAFGLRDATVGLPVTNVDGAMGLPAVYACVRVLSETVASLPLITYQQKGDGSRERASSHGLYELLRYAPNPEMTAFEFEELRTQHVASRGNSYAEIEMSGTGRVTALWPLNPDRMEIWRDAQGELLYIYTLPNGQRKRMAAWQIHHCRGLSSNGIVGYSPLRVAMVAVALGLATEEFGTRFFANGARSGAVLTHPKTLNDKTLANLKASWTDAHGGLENSHRLRILEEGMKLEMIGVPPEEAQFLETRKFQAEEIARIFRMPPHKIGLMDRATFSNIEHQAIEFVTDTIRPWLIRYEQAMRRDLLGTTEAKTLYFEYLTDALLRGDTASRYQAYAVARQWGWMNINDIRGRENMERIAQGDDYLQPLNMVPVGTPPRQPKSTGAEAGEEKPARALAPVLDDVAKRLTRREAHDLKREGVKAMRSLDAAAFRDWLGDFYRDLARTASQAIMPATQAAQQIDGRARQEMAEGLVWQHYMQSLEKASLVVSEAPDAAAALSEYAGLVEAGGSEVLRSRLAGIVEG